MKRNSIRTCLAAIAIGAAGTASFAAQTDSMAPASPGASAMMNRSDKPSQMDMSMDHDTMHPSAAAGAPKGMMCGGGMNSGGAEGASKGMMCGGGMNSGGAEGASKGMMCGGAMMAGQGMMQGKGMGGMGGMGGMMGRMQARHQAMASPQGGVQQALPHLPPGNEKLEFQMHSEMMQKLGEIALKYAERVKEAP